MVHFGDEDILILGICAITTMSDMPSSRRHDCAACVLEHPHAQMLGSGATDCTHLDTYGVSIISIYVASDYGMTFTSQHPVLFVKRMLEAVTLSNKGTVRVSAGVEVSSAIVLTSCASFLA